MKHYILKTLWTLLAPWSLIALAEVKPSLTKEELTKHSSPADCWVLIDGTIYDISSAIRDHKQYKYELDPWCGKDASQAWQTKDGLKKAHSRKAQILLKHLSVGKLE